MLTAKALDDYTDTIQELAALLRRMEYTEPTLAEWLRVGPAIDFSTAMRPVHDRRLQDNTGVVGLIRLLLLSLPMATTDAAALLAPVDLDDLVALELIAFDGDEVRPLVCISPYSDLLLAHDIDTGELAHDHVLGPHGTAAMVDGLTIRRPARRALDIGTGCGFQALLAASHCDEVVATDINPRTVLFGEFNARLNGLANIEFRVGDMLEPVAGEQFDLVVANPPFVISPSTEYVFRDGGLEGDGLSETLIRALPDLLLDGGIGHVVCNWILRGDQEWMEPPVAWAADRGCDLLVVQHEATDPVGYAAAWNERLAPESERFAATLDVWCEYYRVLGVDAIVSGGVVVRKRTSGRNWVRTLVAAAPATRGGGTQIERILAAATEPLGHDEDVLGRRYVLAKHHRLEQRLVYQDTHYQVDTAHLHLDEGFGLRGDVDPPVLMIVLQLDGSTTLRELVAAMAAENDTDAAHLGGAASGAVRTLYELGFVLLA